MNEPEAARRTTLPYPILGALVLFVILWAADFPRPFYDDLFYSGAALNLAKGGDLSNPLLTRQEFPSHHFFVYPPVESYLMGGWLKALGIGTGQMLAFVELSYFCVAAATIVLLRRRGAPVWMEWAAPFAVAAVFLPYGLRAEAPASALALVGLVIATAKRGGMFGLFAGFFSMALGAACAPRVIYFGGALMVFAGWQRWRDETRGQAARGKLLAVMMAACVVAGLLVLWMIGFRVTEFWVTFKVHASRVTGRPLTMFLDYMKHTLGILQWPMVLIPAGLTVEALWRGRERTRALAVCFAGGCALTALTGSLGQGSIWWFIFVMFVLAGVFVRAHPGKLALALQVAMVLSLLVYERKMIVEWYGLASGNISLVGPDHLEDYRKMKPTAEHPLVVDSGAARYVYDYRLPDGVFDLGFCAPFPGGFPGGGGKQDLRAGDIYMAGADMTRDIVFRTYLDLEVPKWQAFGLSMFEYLKYPRQVYVFPAERCVDRRPRNGDQFWLPNGGKSK